MSTNVSFAGQNLQTFNGTNGIIVQDIQHAGKSAKQAQTYALSHGNKSTIPYVEWPSKPITVTGQIVGTNIADLDNQIDIFNSYLTAQNAQLAFDYNGGSLNRQYTATCTNVNVDRPGGLGWANFSITFTATSPFGTDTFYTSLVGNLLANGDFETSTTGWTAVGTCTLTSSTSQAENGTHSLSNVTTAVNSGAISPNVPVGPNGVYTVSAYVYNAAGATLNYVVNQLTSGLGNVGTSTGSIVGTAGWQRITVTINQTTGTTAYLNLQITSATSTTFYVDAVQFEQGAAANTFNNAISLTGNNLAFPFTVLGTAPFQLPIITITFSAIGSAPVSGTVSIGNNSTGQQLNITRTWSATDVLIIDTSLSTNTPVTVNGTAAPFIGAFPAFFSSITGTAGTLTYSDTFASRTFTIAALYYKYYL